MQKTRNLHRARTATASRSWLTEGLVLLPGSIMNRWGYIPGRSGGSEYPMGKGYTARREEDACEGGGGIILSPTVGG